MKHTLTILFILFTLNGFAQSPLAKYSPEWNNPKYLACNTAKNTPYLTENEQQIIYILNLARMDPQLFCRTVLPLAYQISGVDTSSAYYYKSLVTEMSAMKPVKILVPDMACFESAWCHALSSGTRSYVGHQRQTPECLKKKRFNGECCMYGSSSPLDIVLSLLIDEGVESLGHRKICLGSYGKMSASLQPHKGYAHVAVLDFSY
jgi:hypothetical protein